MNRKSKAFTLIELLAVIVILAILALIAIPIVIKIIADSRESSYKRSVQTYGRAVETAIAQKHENGEDSLTDDIAQYDVKTSGHKVECQDNKIFNLGNDNGITLRYCHVVDKKGNKKSKDYMYHGGAVTLEGEAEQVEESVRNEIEVCYNGYSYYEDSSYYTAYENETINEFASREGIANSFNTFIPRQAIDCISGSGNSRYGDRWNVDLNNCTYNNRNNIQVNISHNATLRSSDEGCYISNSYFSIPSSTQSYPNAGGGCLWSETEVIVYDSKKKKKYKKKIKDLTSDDLILAWDFDQGKFVFVKPLWIRHNDKADHYHLLKFSDGSELRIVHNHRIFNCQTNSFESGVEMPIGSLTINAEGKEITLISRERIDEEIEYSSVITDYHMNLFAGNILTSIKLNNLYPIKDMKFDKVEVYNRDKSEFTDMSDEMFKGLRLSEQACSDYYPLEDINVFVEGIDYLNRI